MGSTIRVLVVDDHELFRRAAAGVVEATEGFVLAGCAASGEEALEVAVDLRPDLVLMDVNLTGVDGVAAARRLRALSPPPVVILLSGREEDELERLAQECGAVAYLVKSSFGIERLAAVRALVREGG